jgi:hypothetical protein
MAAPRGSVTSKREQNSFSTRINKIQIPFDITPMCKVKENSYQEILEF